jgi:fatty-acyl-CoA synthase
MGEVLVRSPSVSAGYWERPEESAQTFDRDWCRTGDLGTITSGGYLTITGRKKDMIKSGGENIYPMEIEAVLAEHPDVQEAAVIGVPDPKYIEAVCAVVVARRGASLTEEEVVEHCRAHLAGYKKPRYVICVDALPKTASGKVQKYLLRESYASLGGGSREQLD